jgi:hypothetical protein
MPLAVSQTRAPIPAALKYYALRLFLAACAASLADFLFFREVIGLSLPLFLATLGLMQLAFQKPIELSRRAALILCGFLLALLPLIEEVDFWGLLFGGIGFACFSAMLAPPHAWPGVKRILVRLVLPGAGPFLFTNDTFAALHRLRDGLARRNVMRLLLAWAVPGGLGLVFLLLFKGANPLIGAALDRLIPSFETGFVPTFRQLWWLVILTLVWPLLRRHQAPARPALWQPMRLPTVLQLSDRVSLSALIGFNLLFAVQNVSDLLYLWSGVRLPEGMTYADYAHRGAYALMLASLLAAGFSLLTARRGGPMDRVPRLRPLLLLWAGQCLFLVLSALLRLDLYIEAYALTHFRLAALVWMGLVGLGFALILVWLLRGTSMAWLIRSNTAALLLTLYAACFVDADALIARYNLSHCQEIAGTGPNFDTSYLWSLGPGALPAIIDAQVQLPWGHPLWVALVDKQKLLPWRLGEPPQSWRGWSFRTWRLRQALATRIALAQKRNARDGASHSGGR